jgi:hypothetical protein
MEEDGSNKLSLFKKINIIDIRANSSKKPRMFSLTWMADAFI